MELDQDVKWAIGWNRLNLGLCGIWPEPTTTKDALWSYKSLIIIAWLAIFLTLPQTTNLFMLNGDLDQITTNLCLAIIPTVNAILKVLITSYYREGLKVLVQCFYDDWRAPKTKEETTAMLTTAKVSRFISIACTMLTHMLVTVFVSIRAITIYACDREQEAQENLLIYHAYYPYNVRPPPILVLTNMGQALAAYCITIPYTGVDAFIAMLVLHTCSQFEILRIRLERLMDPRSETRSMVSFKTELVSIVKRHEHLNWVASKIEEYFNMLLLIQVLLCTIEICFQGFLFFNFALNSEDGIWNFQLLFFALFVSFIVVHMYIYCYVGEMLLVQSNGMAISAYNSTWFNVSCQEAKCLLFIMNRSIRPLRLTAGKFGTFSIEMFSAILRTAMGYLSVLLTVSAGKD
ncbi:odorant receptor 13a-like [Andrena cerasifolii]|uniref:odorant receptor 13a-like n=1 Tax=Andrena cerasifolii TaxID=2819439 RepID=UPI0040377D54